MNKGDFAFSKMKQFASNFTPIFQASTLTALCNHPSEKTEIHFLFNYWPFRKYKPSISPSKNSSPKKSTELRSEDKELIKTEWQSHFASGSITFDDKSLMNKVNENLTKPDTGFQLEMDEDSNEIKFEKKREMAETDSNNNNTNFNFNVQEQLYQDKLDYELEKYKSVVMTTISQERGNQLEKFIIEKINQDEKMNFVQDKTLKTVDLGIFKLCGIVDGIDESKKILIEVKTRKYVDMNKKTIDLKDKLQCLTYMKLTNCERCLLVVSGPSGMQNKTYID